MSLSVPVSRSTTPRSRVVAAASAAALTALVAGAVVWSVLDRTVTLQVDGRAQQVDILGSEVTDVLAAAGVEVGARDLVSPAVGETVADGDEVVVRYARQVRVADPAGQERSFWTTELTVDEALRAAGVRTEDAWLSTSRSAGIGRDGLSLTMSLPKDLTVVHGGQTEQVTSPAPTVADLLDELGVVVDADDRMDADPAEVLVDGRTVTVQQVTIADVSETVAVERGVRTVSDADLLVGRTEVREAGADGEQRVTYHVTTVDGVQESREEIGRTTTREPVERVVATGTKKPAPVPAPVVAAPEPAPTRSSRPAPAAAAPAPAAPAPAPAPAAPAPAAPAPAPAAGGGVDSLNWAALAACESGGNPSIVSRNGLYHGLYQFSTGTWASVGGSGLPSQASAGEQTARAKALYSRSGAGPWPHCGSRLFG